MGAKITTAAMLKTFYRDYFEKSSAPVREFLATAALGTILPMARIGGPKMTRFPERKPGFFSPLERALTGEGGKASKQLISKEMMPAHQVSNILAKSGVTPTELKWTGVGEVLAKAGNNPISLEEIRRIAEAGRIEVETPEFYNQTDSWQKHMERSGEGHIYKEPPRPYHPDASYRAPFTPGEGYREDAVQLTGGGFEGNPSHLGGLENNAGWVRSDLQKTLEPGTRKLTDVVADLEGTRSVIAQLINRQAEGGEPLSGEVRERLRRREDKFVKEFQQHSRAKAARTLQEVQSDWEKAGRKSGYQDSTMARELVRVEEELKKAEQASQIRYEKVNQSLKRRKLLREAKMKLLDNKQLNYGSPLYEKLLDAYDREAQRTKEYEAKGQYSTERDLRMKVREIKSKMGVGAPDTPFRGDKAKEVAIRNWIYKALERGERRIAWAGGEHQLDRWPGTTEATGFRLDQRPDSQGRTMIYPTNAGDEHVSPYRFDSLEKAKKKMGPLMTEEEWATLTDPAGERKVGLETRVTLGDEAFPAIYGGEDIGLQEKWQGRPDIWAKATRPGMGKPAGKVPAYIQKLFRREGSVGEIQRLKTPEGHSLFGLDVEEDVAQKILNRGGFPISKIGPKQMQNFYKEMYYG